MLHDLDETVRALLAAELTDLAPDHIHFEAPDSEFRSEPPALNFFLYDVRENLDLRAADWSIEKIDGDFVKQRAPRRVDCSYLITAWADGAISEHTLLGKVMQVLLRRPVIPPELIQGTVLLKHPLPTSLLQQSTLQSIGEFWQAMRTRPRVAIAYTVTVAVAIIDPVTVGPAHTRVLQTRQLGSGQPEST